MTTVIVPRTLRPIDAGMFVDLGIAAAGVSFTPVVGGGVEVDITPDITADQTMRVRVRLMTTDATSEAEMVAARQALADIKAFVAVKSPTAAQVTAAVQSLAELLDALVAYVAGDVLT